MRNGTTTDRIAVVGGGIVGCAAALVLERRLPGRVVHVAPDAPPDERTTALLDDAVQTLAELGVWEVVAPAAAPLRTMRLLDGSRRLLRARPLEFASHEIGLPQFGFNVRNDALVAAMERTPGPERLRTTLVAMRREGASWRLRLGDGAEIDAAAVVGADGRASTVRDEAGIGVRRWTYPQTALVTTFAHDLPHAGVSTEWHTETGPFTQVPLPGAPDAPHRSSLVHVVRPQDAAALEALPTEELSREIAGRMQYLLGAVRAERRLAGYPLGGLVADRFGHDGVFLVGEAAHVFPPIGAQGANLGFRDIADCAACLARGGSAEAASQAYDGKRRLDVAARTGAVDALNRSLLTSFLPVHAARVLGTSLVARSDALRRTMMRWGLTRGTDRQAAPPSS